MTKTGLKTGQVLKFIGLPFESFDFVVDSFNWATRNVGEVIVKESMTLVHRFGSDFFQFLDAGLFCIREPCIQKWDG